MANDTATEIWICRNEEPTFFKSKIVPYGTHQLFHDDEPLSMT